MNNQPQLYYQCRVTDSDGKGRIKAKYIRLEQAGHDVFTPWIQTLTSVYGEGKEGMHSRLKVGDLVIVSFLDFPQNQFPFVIGKLQKEVERINVDEQSVITYNEHTLTFNTDNIEIQHKDGTKITLEDNKITFINAESLTSVKYNDLDLIDWLKTLLGPPSTLQGNLGYPVLESTQITKLLEAIAKASTSKSVTFE